MYVTIPPTFGFSPVLLCCYLKAKIQMCWVQGRQGKGFFSAWPELFHHTVCMLIVGPILDQLQAREHLAFLPASSLVARHITSSLLLMITFHFFNRSFQLNIYLSGNAKYRERDEAAQFIFGLDVEPLFQLR